MHEQPYQSRADYLYLFTPFYPISFIRIVNLQDITCTRSCFRFSGSTKGILGWALPADIFQQITSRTRLRGHSVFTTDSLHFRLSHFCDLGSTEHSRGSVCFLLLFLSR